ncbi:hypothetical protein CYMTET_2650 [Cymbomonas tetramitiformis]|uniref:Uncharacterized protein n=1 Tax=Cymbomonas tetramitiformis TaxID=36881 RepID=A0AAE0H578_9CHLO|nr:hypothetical protein CYMTET_38756 [Cymbomonas tetramitiformis]KAK3289176.1 hypothetical protein CYMTET_3380 [Cymbomonas tetramitiformis]KAK3289936.1 hypothetical protein CYMTET_2650 [Cymbomonas tetramitiformis]
MGLHRDRMLRVCVHLAYCLANYATHTARTSKEYDVRIELLRVWLPIFLAHRVAEPQRALCSLLRAYCQVVATYRCLQLGMIMWSAA